jgi:excinuclease UvrABC nuclease subunit
MRKRNKKADEGRTNTIDCLQVLQGEQAEAVQLLQPHYPEASDDELYERAKSLRRQRYALGRWPTAEEIEAGKLSF